MKNLLIGIAEAMLVAAAIPVVLGIFDLSRAGVEAITRKLESAADKEKEN